MRKKTAAIVFIGCCIVAGAGIWWYKHRAPASAAEATASEALSALVKTQKIEQQKVDSSLQVFGDVQSAKIDSLSFPQAGQLTMLAVQVGQQVKSGEIVARLTTDPTAYAAYQQALSALNFARTELKREEELFALKLLTQTQLDTARKQLTDAEAILVSQKKLGSETDTAQLTAPMDGVITALVATQGDRLAAGSPVVQMGESKGIRILLGIEPSLRHLIKVGVKVMLAPIQNPELSVTAKIAELQTIVDPKTQLVNAIVLLPASNSATLVPGMHVLSTIYLGQQSAWLAPRSAVLSDEKGSYIFQVADGKAKRVEVKTVSETATQFGIEGEIDPKLPLVVLGNYELEDDIPAREGAK